MGTVYSGNYSTGTYTYTRVKVDYSGTSATAYLLHTRTNSWGGYEYTDGATFTFGGQSTGFSGGVSGQHTDVVIAQVSFTISTSGGTYSGSTSGSVGPFSFSGSVTIPAQGYDTTPTLTLTGITETSLAFSWSSNTEVTTKVDLKYKLRSASPLIPYSTLNIYNNSTGATSGTGTITGLSLNSQYAIYAVCTKKTSGVTSNTATLYATTYNYPYITAIGTKDITLNAPGTNHTQSISLYNPLGRSVTLYAKKDNTGGTQFNNSATTTSTSANITLVTNTMYSSIPNSTSGKIVYYCAYNDGSATHTSATVAGTYQTSATNCGPTMSTNPTYTNTNSAHTTLVGSNTIIQGQSSFSITAGTTSAKANSGATISKYYFKIGDGAYESGTSATKTYTSTSLGANATISVYAEDSRGYTTAVKTTTMRILPYAAPAANFTVARSGYTTNGSITLVSATRSVLSKSSATSTDVNKWIGNTSSNQISVSASSGLTLSAAVIGGTGASLSSGTVTFSNADVGATYTITINISDKITTKTLTYTINKASPIMSLLNNNRVGINTMSPSCALDVNGATNLAGNVAITGNLTNVSGTAKITGATTAAAITASGQIKTTNATASSSTSTGSIVASGGIGVAKNSYFGGTVNISSNTTIGGTLTVSSKTLLDWTHPIGSIYTSTVSTSPATLFGGTWEQIKDMFLLAAGDTYTAGDTGGEATHTLSRDEMPAHSHAETIMSNGGYAGLGVGNYTYHPNDMLSGTGGYVSGGTWVAASGWATETYNTGGGQAHNNMPPYLVVYAWKRTA